MPLSYRDMEWYLLHHADPPPWEQPQLFLDEAPVPIPVQQDGDGEQLLNLLPGWLSQLGVPWDQEELRWWSCPSGPLVVWRRGRR